MYGQTPLCVACVNDHLDVVRYLVEQGADIEKCNHTGPPIIWASSRGCLEVTRYLLEQGANRDKADDLGKTPLHFAAIHGHLEIAKLLMVYGADLNATDIYGLLPIDRARTEEMRQAIRDEPRRRMDHGHKRATEQDRHPNAATSASAQQEDDEEDEEVPSNKKPRVDEGEVEDGVVAEEDQNSEPSDDEDGN